MIGSEQAETLAAFYEAVFGKAADMEEGGYHGWLVGSSFINIYEHSQVKGKSKEPPRIMFCFETKEVKEEFERIKEIEGAQVIKEPYHPAEGEDMMIATLADPDGNYFQLMSPWEPE